MAMTKNGVKKLSSKSPISKTANKLIAKFSKTKKS